MSEHLDVNKNFIYTKIPRTLIIDESDYTLIDQSGGGINLPDENLYNNIIKDIIKIIYDKVKPYYLLPNLPDGMKNYTTSTYNDIERYVDIVSDEITRDIINRDAKYDNEFKRIWADDNKIWIKSAFLVASRSAIYSLPFSSATAARARQ
jgi:hypothetical protein